MTYQYQEYPKALYRGDEYREAVDEASEASLRAEGFACFYEQTQDAPPSVDEPEKRRQGRHRRAP